MHIVCVKNHGIDYLQIQESYSVKINGSLKNRKRVLRNVDKSDAEIISKYRGLSRIEDSFRITKSDLEGRPVYARTPEHVNAHFLLCFIALTMIRIIQYKVLKRRGKESLNIDGWESGVTAERIQKALGSWDADGLSKEL